MATRALRDPVARHVCAIAHDDVARAGIAAAWVAEGLQLDERVLWAQRPGGPLFDWFDRHQVDWRGPMADGRLVVREPEDMLQLGSADDIPGRVSQVVTLTREARADGLTGLRIGAETDIALTVMPDVPTQLKFELAWEQVTRTQPVSVLCIYDPRVHGRDLATGIRRHPREFTDGLATATADAEAISLSGEVDLSNADSIGTFLDAAAADRAPAEPVLVDLSSCGFIDLAGASALVAFGRSRAPGGVRVLNPPPSLNRILQLQLIDDAGVLDVTVGEAW